MKGKIKMNSEIFNSNIVFPQEFLDTYREINNLEKLIEEYEVWRTKNGRTFNFDFTPLIKAAMEKK